MEIQCGLNIIDTYYYLNTSEKYEHIFRLVDDEKLEIYSLLSSRNKQTMRSR